MSEIGVVPIPMDMMGHAGPGLQNISVTGRTISTLNIVDPPDMRAFTQVVVVEKPADITVSEAGVDSVHAVDDASYEHCE